MSLNVRKYYDDKDKPYWDVEKRSKPGGRVCHETLATFDNGKDAEDYRKTQSSRDTVTASD